MQNLILNRYRPLETAGSGGFGTVVSAWDTRIQRRVAIKCLRLEGYIAAANPAAVRDIPGLEEARTAALLSDASIVGVIDFEMYGPMAYLIMEYVDGATLTELLEYEGALSLGAATAVFEAVSHALQVAHENQVLHLDIKPDNVLINRQGQVKVADFGLAQLSHEAGFGKAAGGTIGYMPLEQMRLEPPDVRTDEWALAALTYEMLMGENPFIAPNLEQAQHAIEEAEVVIPSLARVDLGEEVDEALFGALAIAREDRFDSVALFADAMMPHLGNARAGQGELASLVAEVCFDGETYSEEDALAYGEGEGVSGQAFAQSGEDASPGRGILGFLRRGRGQADAGAGPADAAPYEPTEPYEPYDLYARESQAAQPFDEFEEDAFPREPFAWQQDGRAFVAPDAAGACAVPARHEGRVHGTGRPRMAAVLAHRAWSASAAALAGFAAASHIPGLITIAGRLTPEFWGFVLACALAGLLLPAAGALAVVAALAVACVFQGAYVLAALCGVAGAAWWIMCGRRGAFESNVGAGVPLMGALHVAAAAPLAAALFLRPKDALVTAAYGVVVAFVVACTGSCALESWNVLAVSDAFAASGVQACAGVLLANPGVWAEAVLWIAAAGVGSAACERGRLMATCGMVLAGALTLAGMCAPVYFATQGASVVPAAVPLVACVCATLAGAVLAARGVPARLRQE